MAIPSSDSPKATTSSFFRKTSTAAAAAAGASSSSAAPVEIVTLDSSDDDNMSDIDFGPPLKKPKVELITAEAPSLPAPAPRAAAPSLAPIFTKQPRTPAPPSRPPAAPRVVGPTPSLKRWAFDPSQPSQTRPRASSDGPSQLKPRQGSTANSGLLARNLLAKQRTSYLQPEHYLAANGEEVIGPGRAAGDEDEEDDALEVDDDEDSDDAGPPIKSKKGKGKSTSDDETLPPPGASRLAKFAHKPPPTKATKAATVAPSGVKFTPLEQQVLALQAQHPGVILMVEVGYKFKFFQSDAQFASRVLGIACFQSKSMLTASVPVGRLTVHCKRLLAAGAKVGIVRQTETVALKKIGNNKSAPFTRELTNLYTSSTYIDQLSVDPLEHGGVTATLLCVVEEGHKKPVKSKENDGEGEKGDGKVRIGLVAVLPSTGEVIYDSFEDSYTRSELETRLLHLQPSELLLQKDMSRQTESMLSYVVNQDVTGTGNKTRVDRIANRMKADAASTFVSSYYTNIKAAAAEAAVAPSNTITLSDDEDQDEEMAAPPSSQSLHEVLDLPPLVLVALTALIKHLEPFKLDSIFAHSTSFTHFAQRGAMMLNANTLASLEIVVNQTDFKERGSLLSVVDRTQSPFGRRLLRRWVTKPLVSISAIRARQDAVTELLENSGAPAVAGLRTLFHGLPDLERGLVRIALGQATPLELIRTLEAFRRVASFAPKETEKRALQSSLLRSLVASLPTIRDEVDEYLAQIDGPMARKGVKEHLFAAPVPEEVQDAQDCLSLAATELEAELVSVRKILKRPKLEYISVGQEDFLIEVRIADAKKSVPDNWIKVNSTRQAYRYRTPGMIARMDELAQCKERLAAVADAAYKRFLARVAQSYDRLKQVTMQVATADALLSLASVAMGEKYCKPVFVEEVGVVDIRNGRHPVLELLHTTPPVPNSIKMGGGEPKQIVLTGLNMGGKSSTSRMVALIILMAQLGCYVPAEYCKLSLFDSCFTRMGASDDLARGRSTFMVEMSETSEILRLATPRSLIVLDELGRGTSTHDGQAIASAVLETIVTKVKALTLFVTHYPGLADLAKRFPEQVGLKHMASLETSRENGFPQLVFLYKIIDGVASSSHGLSVAALAGLPQSVLVKARDKSREVEATEHARLLQRRSERFAGILKALAAREGLPPSLSQSAPSQSVQTEDESSSPEKAMSRARLVELCEALVLG